MQQDKQRRTDASISGSHLTKIPYNCCFMQDDKK
jgi:hypothetical protein